MNTRPLRYAVQEHFTEAHHFDLLFERDDALVTWSIADFFALLRGEPCEGKKLIDHRLKYLDYEGEIPGKGRVRLAARGYCEWQRIDLDVVELRLDGDALRGRLAFRRSTDDASGTNWIVQFYKELQ